MDNNETNITNEPTGIERPVRPHRRPASEDKYFKIRNVLNIVFMLLAVVGAVVYVTYDVPTGGWVIGAAVIVKSVEVALRLFKV